MRSHRRCNRPLNPLFNRRFHLLSLEKQEAPPQTSLPRSPPRQPPHHCQPQLTCLAVALFHYPPKPPPYPLAMQLICHRIPWRLSTIQTAHNPGLSNGSAKTQTFPATTPLENDSAWHWRPSSTRPTKTTIIMCHRKHKHKHKMDSILIFFRICLTTIVLVHPGLSGGMHPIGCRTMFMSAFGSRAHHSHVTPNKATDTWHSTTMGSLAACRRRWDCSRTWNSYSSATTCNSTETFPHSWSS